MSTPAAPMPGAAPDLGSADAEGDVREPARSAKRPHAEPKTITQAELEAMQQRMAALELENAALKQTAPRSLWQHGARAAMMFITLIMSAAGTITGPVTM